MANVASAQPQPDPLASALAAHPKMAALFHDEPEIAAFAKANPDLVVLALKDPAAVESDARVIEWASSHPILALKLRAASKEEAEVPPGKDPKVEEAKAKAKAAWQKVIDTKAKLAGAEPQSTALGQAAGAAATLGAGGIAGRGITAPSGEAQEKYAEAKRRWGLLFQWAGGDAAHLKDKVHESSRSVDNWLAFSRKWDNGKPDLSDLSPQIAELVVTESNAKLHGYGAPPEALTGIDIEAAAPLLRGAAGVNATAREIPGLGAATDPALVDRLTDKANICKADLSKLTPAERVSRVALCKDEPWLSTGEKLALGVGGAGLLALILYSALKPARAY